MKTGTGHQLLILSILLTLGCTKGSGASGHKDGGSVGADGGKGGAFDSTSGGNAGESAPGTGGSRQGGTSGNTTGGVGGTSAGGNGGTIAGGIGGTKQGGMAGNAVGGSGGLLAIPDRLVVLTMDDSVKSHVTIAAPLLKTLGFGATFFITEGFTFTTNKTDYMTWAEIRSLHDDGFEIGNHTRDHLLLDDANIAQLDDQLKAVEDHCVAAGIPKPVTFAYPANRITTRAFPILDRHGIKYARRGSFPELPLEAREGFAYEPGLDHPLFVPTTVIFYPESTFDEFTRGLAKATNGNVVVLMFHGVPEGEHPQVSTTRASFEKYMMYLKDNNYTVIAMRDLAKYRGTSVRPVDPYTIINAR